MKNPIRAVLFWSFVFVGLNLGAAYTTICNSYDVAEKDTSEEGPDKQTLFIETKNNMQLVDGLKSSINVEDVLIVKAEMPSVIENYEEPIIEEVVIESISMRGAHGKVSTEPVVLQMSAIDEVNQTEFDIPKWDIHERINTINILWEFLVNQQGVSEHIASAIIGSICCEGDFGQIEGTNKQLQSIEEARRVLGDGDQGYGLSQWTFGSRQKTLLQYYELAYEQYPDDWEKVRIIAECCMLLEEIKAYEVFNDITANSVSIEEAVGRLSKHYFKYEGYGADWSGYKLNAGKSNGRSRYNYAMSVYGYFTDVYE